MKWVINLVAFAVVLAPTFARAQINGPAPTLAGQPSTHLYTIPGVRRATGLRTAVSCSNVSNGPIRVGVELFDSGGGAALNDASLGSWELPAGGARTFATGPFIQEFALGGWSDVSVPTAVSFIGSARVLATSSSGIICSAFLIEPVGSPPASMVGLTIVKKTKQKGD
jgi:hypothetical protein